MLGESYIGVKDANDCDVELVMSRVEEMTAFDSSTCNRALELTNKALDLANQKLFEGALKVFNEAISAAPPTWKNIGILYCGRGATFIEQRRYEAAIMDLTTALRHIPASPLVTMLLGRANLMLGYYKVSTKLFKEALWLSSKDIDLSEMCATGLKDSLSARYAYNLASKAIRANNFSDLLSCSDKLLSVSPRCATGAYFRAFALSQLELWCQCIEHCELVCIVPDVYSGDTSLFPISNKVSALRSALRMTSQSAEIYMKALFAVDRIADAQLVMEVFIVRFPDETWCRDALFDLKRAELDQKSDDEMESNIDVTQRANAAPLNNPVTSSSTTSDTTRVTLYVNTSAHDSALDFTTGTANEHLTQRNSQTSPRSTASTCASTPTSRNRSVIESFHGISEVLETDRIAQPHIVRGSYRASARKYLQKKMQKIGRILRL